MKTCTYEMRNEQGDLAFTVCGHPVMEIDGVLEHVDVDAEDRAPGLEPCAACRLEKRALIHKAMPEHGFDVDHPFVLDVLTLSHQPEIAEEVTR